MTESACRQAVGILAPSHPRVVCLCACFPIFQGLIQGPIFISGGDSPNVPGLAFPLMLPGEINPDTFQVPPNAAPIDETNALVVEDKQVDRIIFNNVDVRGNLSSVGTLTPDVFSGMTMGQNIFIQSLGPFSGIAYEGIEVITWNLGDGVDSITVENTSEAIHVMNLGGEDDDVTVKSLSGPLLINGEGGTDSVRVSSDKDKLEQIDALLCFDGGGESDDDVLTLDNSGDWDLDDVLVVTRLMVQVASMEAPALELGANESLDALALEMGANESAPEMGTNGTKNPILPRDSYLINLRNVAGGNFTLTVHDPETGASATSKTFDYNDVTAKELKAELNALILGGPPDGFCDGLPKSCGQSSESCCADSVDVWRLGDSDTFAIFFVGEKLNAGVTLELDKGSDDSLYNEIYLNVTNDILGVNSDVAYTNVDFLHVKMGHQDITSNVRGTSAATYLYTQEGHDKFFLASDAVENETTSSTTDVLYGFLDYMGKDLHILAGSGRHRLLMSDAFSTVAKGRGVGGPAELTNSSLTNLHETLGNIYFDFSTNDTLDVDGNWYGGIDLWLGGGDDRLSVTSVQALPPYRTTTSVHAGDGRDVIGIDLEDSPHSLFVGNGQAGDDVLDASSSSLPVILFGDGGNDDLVGGAAEDVLIGDYGRVFWEDENGTEVARVGGGGYGDYTDGEVRQIRRIEVVFPPPEIRNDTDFDLAAGNDTILGNGARDVIFGGGGEGDELHGNNGSDFILGDFGLLIFDVNDTLSKNLYGIRSIDSYNCSAFVLEETSAPSNESSTPSPSLQPSVSLQPTVEPTITNFIYGDGGDGKCLANSRLLILLSYKDPVLTPLH